MSENLALNPINIPTTLQSSENSDVQAIVQATYCVTELLMNTTKVSFAKCIQLNEETLKNIQVQLEQDSLTPEERLALNGMQADLIRQNNDLPLLQGKEMRKNVAIGAGVGVALLGASAAYIHIRDNY